MAKSGEYWIVRLHNREREIVLIGADEKVYPCGDEQGWPQSAVTQWIRKVRL